MRTCRYPRRIRIRPAAGILLLSAVGCYTCLLADESLSIDRLQFVANNPLEVSNASTEFANGSHWQLDASELQRAQRLNREFRQYVSDRRISPLEVLGIHARHEEERRRYARLWAKLMVEDAERTLAFQLAYDQAIAEIVRDRPLINVSKLPPRASPINEILASDRLALFTKSDCLVCDEVLRLVLSAAEQVAGVDIYVMGLPNSNPVALHRWASHRHISPSSVRAKLITLNFDNGLLSQLNPRITEAPVVMRRRDDRFELIDPWKL